MTEKPLLLLAGDFQRFRVVDRIKGRLRTGQLLRRFLILACCFIAVVVDVAVIHNIALAIGLFARFRQFLLHFSQLVFPFGQLRNQDEHFIYCQVKSWNCMGRVEQIDRMLYPTDLFLLYNCSTGGGCFERTKISFISFR